MTIDADLCPWSDLPPTMCEHCKTGDRTVGTIGQVTYEPPSRVGLRVVHPVRRQPPVAQVGAVHIDTDLAVDLVDYVTDLTRPTIRRQGFTVGQVNGDGSTTWVQQRHQTTSPSLLEQLWGAVEASGSVEGGQRTFRSKPSARLDAIDAAQRIDTGAFTWLRRLGLPDVYDDYTLPDTAAAITRLGSLVPSQQQCTRKRPARDHACCVAHHIEQDIRSWWITARVLTGWDSPAWQPANTCPVCEAKGGLRVKLEHRTAVCVECGSTWSAETIGLLADHIRFENHEDETVETG